MFLCAPPLFHKATVPLALTQKGYGTAFRAAEAGTGSLTLAYGTVLGGSAPAAGDLVVWHGGAMPYSGGGTSYDPTGSGWAYSSGGVAFETSSFYPHYFLMAKVVTSGDLASPFVKFDHTAFSGSFAMWRCFSFVGNITSLTANSWVTQTPVNGDPGSIAIDSSALNAPDVAVTCAVFTGTDDSLSASGMTPDFSASRNNNEGYNGSDLLLWSKSDVGGAAYTLDKIDDGFLNASNAAYLRVAG